MNDEIDRAQESIESLTDDEKAVLAHVIDKIKKDIPRFNIETITPFKNIGGLVLQWINIGIQMQKNHPNDPFVTGITKLNPLKDDYRYKGD